MRSAQHLKVLVKGADDVSELIPIDDATHVKDFRFPARKYLRKLVAGEEVEHPFELEYAIEESYVCVRPFMLRVLSVRWVECEHSLRCAL